MKTNDKIKAVVEEFEEEFAPFIAECFHYDTGHSIAPLARKQKKWLQHRLEALVREERERIREHIENIRFDYGGTVDVRSAEWGEDMMRSSVLKALTPPITNNKN